MRGPDIVTIGYVLIAPDNNSYMLRGDMPHPACPGCGMVSDREWIDPSFKPGKTDLDASYTYDGYLIVSERFRSAVAGEDVRFHQLPSAPGFYSLIVENAVRFHAARRKTTFERRCLQCWRFFVVAGATPVFLKSTGPLADKMYRTDVEFGTGDEQHPLIVVGPGLGEQLRVAGLEGVDLRLVSD